MKKYIITGKKFEGEIWVLFNSGKLAKVDFLQATLTDQQREYFLKIMAVREEDIEDMMKQLRNCRIVSEDYTVTLEEFKSVYPYARNSHLLPPVWNKMSQSDQVLAWASAIEYARYCKQNGWYKPKIAAKWLKDREFLNNWRTM